MDDEAGIGSAPDARHPDPAARLARHLGHHGHVAAEARVQCDAARGATGCRLPRREAFDGIQNGQLARLPLQQAAAQRERRGAQARCCLVEEALDGERGV